MRPERRRRVHRKTTVLALVTAAVSASFGCARVGPGVDGVVSLAPPGREALTMTYLGTGGWIIEHGDTQVLTAPLFSNPSFLRTGLARIASDTTEVDRWMARYDVSNARVILSGHAHYDHLMDVPRVATRHAPGARILANRTAANILGPWSGVHDRVDAVEAAAGDARSPGSWLRFGDVRIMPLRSHHAPHFAGYTLYRGTVEHVRAEQPRYATEWLDGETLAFLIDFLDRDGAVAFRVYYQDAVTEPPSGFAPIELIAEHPVDVAILVPATFDQVDWHPEAFVENLRPERIVLGHWEDFFIPLDEPTRSIMLSDIEHFERRLTRVFGGPWWRPEIGTVFRFPR